jgi:hypothetical protein
MGARGVGFHNFSIAEDRYVRLLVRSIGTYMPQDVSERT